MLAVSYYYLIHVFNTCETFILSSLAKHIVYNILYKYVRVVKSAFPVDNDYAGLNVLGNILLFLMCLTLEYYGVVFKCTALIMMFSEYNLVPL